MVLGTERVELVSLDETTPYFKGSVKRVPAPQDSGPEVEALLREVLELSDRLASLVQPQLPIDFQQILGQLKESSRAGFYSSVAPDPQSGKAAVALRGVHLRSSSQAPAHLSFS